MNSYILVSNTTEKQQTFLNNFIALHNISSFDIQSIAEESLSPDKGASIGIEVVRKLQETIFLKPYKGKEKILILNHAEKLTTEAQNALLKLLEEPPIYLNIFLCSTTDEVFLPTVLSRCQTIQLDKPEPYHLPEDPIVAKEMEENLTYIMHGTIAEKLVLAEKVSADKENISFWFTNITHFVRERMLETIDQKEVPLEYSLILMSLQEAYKTISSTNVNPRSILEHCFLSIT